MITSAEDFVRLRASSDPAEYRKAAHDDASIQTWLEVIRDHKELRFWVAQNKTVPVIVLELLADDEDSRVRSMVASKRKLPENLQLKLANDPDPSVRSRIAQNAKATHKVLQILSQDDVLEIRAKVLERLASTEECS